MSRESRKKLNQIASNQRGKRAELQEDGRIEAFKRLLVHEGKRESAFFEWAPRWERGEISAGRFREEVGSDYVGAVRRWYKTVRSEMKAQAKGMYLAGMISREEYRAIKEVLGVE